MYNVGINAIAMLLNSPDIEVNPTLTVILEKLCIVPNRYVGINAIAMLLNSPDIEVNPTVTVILENCIVQCRY